MPPLKKFDEKVNFMARAGQVAAVRGLAREAGVDDSVVWRELVDEALRARALATMSDDPAAIGSVMRSELGRRLPHASVAA